MKAKQLQPDRIKRLQALASALKEKEDELADPRVLSGVTASVIKEVDPDDRLFDALAEMYARSKAEGIKDLQEWRIAYLAALLEFKLRVRENAEEEEDDSVAEWDLGSIWNWIWGIDDGGGSAPPNTIMTSDCANMRKTLTHLGRAYESALESYRRCLKGESIIISGGKFDDLTGEGGIPTIQGAEGRSPSQGTTGATKKCEAEKALVESLRKQIDELTARYVKAGCVG